MRPYYVSALYGAFFFLLSVLLGFHFNRARKVQRLPTQLPDRLLWYYGIRVSIIGFLLFTISTGGNVAKLINPLDAEYVGQTGGSFGNYLGLSLNFMIPGISLLFLYFLKTGKGWIWLVVLFLVSVGIFITLGFRYRLVLLVGALTIIYYFFRNKRPNVVFVVAGIYLFIQFMGILNITRRYGTGLDINKLEESTSETYYQKGVEEARIFQTSGAVIEMVPERYPHAGIQPILSTLLFPIPSALYPEKNSAGYLFDMLDFIYGKKISKGAAMMSYGEYYLAFGWAGIIAGGFIIGWFSKKLWAWYLVNRSNSFALVVYAVTVTYLYVVLSRGYLPQVTNLFFFTVVPAYVVLRLVFNRYRRAIVRRKLNVA
jgi:oligosaccharide repeat unit polymerase